MALYRHADMVRTIAGARCIKFLSGFAGSQAEDALAEAQCGGGFASRAALNRRPKTAARQKTDLHGPLVAAPNAVAVAPWLLARIHGARVEGRLRHCPAAIALRRSCMVGEAVFVECGSMYRADGPTELKLVGETEFVNGTSAMSASGQYVKGRLCAGIVGHADLRRRRSTGLSVPSRQARRHPEPPPFRPVSCAARPNNRVNPGADPNGNHADLRAGPHECRLS
jgi:hypothetical protein